MGAKIGWGIGTRQRYLRTKWPVCGKGFYMMPVGEHRYKVGATYTWDELNWATTDSAREELLAKLGKIISASSEVLNQQVGIRPTMHDRKPVIGIHPDHPQIGIFNGLGSKSVLLGPYFARQFVDSMIRGSRYIHPEADIKRYFGTNDCFE